MPNFPNYRLGPLENSPCDTLNIDNPPPTALFEYSIGPAPLTIAFIDGSNYAQEWYWDFGDNVTSTLRHPIHMYTQGGTYEVCLTANNASGSDTYCSTVILTEVATHEAGQKEINASIFPNPSADQITLRIENLPAGPVAFLVYDALGRTVLHRSLPVNAHRIEQRLDISNLAAGVYFWRVATGDGNAMEGKFFVGK